MNEVTPNRQNFFKEASMKIPPNHITFRWLGLLGINLLFFNTPAGSCSADLATGFPMAFHILPNDASETRFFDPFLMAVDAVVCALLIFLLFTCLKRRFHFKTPIGARTFKLVVGLFALVNVLVCYSVSNSKFFEDVAGTLMLIFYGPLIPFVELKVFDDPVRSVTRIGILPILTLHYFLIYGISFGISRFLQNRRRVEKAI